MKTNLKYFLSPLFVTGLLFIYIILSILFSKNNEWGMLLMPVMIIFGFASFLIHHLLTKVIANYAKNVIIETLLVLLAVLLFWIWQ